MAAFPVLRRRNYLVNRGLQLRFIGLLLLQMGFVLAALAVLVSSHVDRIAEVADSVPFVDARSRAVMQSEVIDNMHGFWMRSLVLSGATVVLLVAFGLLASHKIAGPVIKLERWLETVPNPAAPGPIQFRRGDNLDEFAGVLNRMAASVEARRARVRAAGAELVRLGENLDDGPSRATCLARMRQTLAGLREAV